MEQRKQTAVDFLLHELSEIVGVIAPDAFSASLIKIKYEQAKEMEKKEHERIADKAREDGWRDAKYGGQRW